MFVELFGKLVGRWFVSRAWHDREMVRLNALIAQKEEELWEVRGIVEKALRAASLVPGATDEQIEVLKVMTELYLDKQGKTVN
jgi:alkylhydroperoxidase/carboxymuconolactone decarboxylase family protein YurZ